MAKQFSVFLRGKRADEVVASASNGWLDICKGTKPANCAAARSVPDVLSEIDLPAPALTNTSGTISKAGTWAGTGKVGIVTANATHYRMYLADHATCFAQGDVTVTGGSGQLQMDDISIAALQAITLQNYVTVEPNA